MIDVLRFKDSDGYRRIFWARSDLRSERLRVMMYRYRQEHHDRHISQSVDVIHISPIDYSARAYSEFNWYIFSQDRAGRTWRIPLKSWLRHTPITPRFVGDIPDFVVGETA